MFYKNIFIVTSVFRHRHHCLSRLYFLFLCCSLRRRLQQIYCTPQDIFGNIPMCDILRLESQGIFLTHLHSLELCYAVRAFHFFFTVVKATKCLLEFRTTRTTSHTACNKAKKIKTIYASACKVIMAIFIIYEIGKFQL